MPEIVDRMIYCINNVQSNYKASIGLKSDTAEIPVTETAVYFTVNEVRVNEADIIVHVYTPVSKGGYRGIATACEVYNLLFENGFKFKSVHVGKTDYSKDSVGFITKLYLTAADESLESETEEPDSVPPELLAIEVTNRKLGDIWFTVSGIELSYGYACYPVETVLSDTPIDYINEKVTCKIKLTGVGNDTIKRLARYARFNLRIQKTEDRFVNCVCDKGGFVIGEDTGEITLTCEA